MNQAKPPGLVIVGGGPAGLMAAEVAAARGLSVDLYESRGSVGRKFLIAGRGGLNLTHSDSPERFRLRYGARAPEVSAWLREFDNTALREWALGLGVETFVGSSGRVFPADMKAAPLLRAWVRRLRESGVRFHVGHVCQGWDEHGALRFDSPSGTVRVPAGATVLALGGGSWPQLGSDGAWTQWLGARGIDVAALQPSNCGFDLAWSEHFADRFAGHPVKPAWLGFTGADGETHRLQGEFVITRTGIEGSLVYALSARIRDALANQEPFRLELDLAPNRDEAWLAAQLGLPAKGRSASEIWRRRLGLHGVQAGLLHELVSREEARDPRMLARRIKALPLRPLRARPLAEAISSAGGVRFSALDEALMLRELPGVFCAGEMIDWEAPTGGFLLAASFASGRRAGHGAADWLKEHPPVA